MKNMTNDVLLVCHGGVCRAIHSYFNDMTNDEIYTFDEVLQILKTSKQQLRKLLKNGEIKGFKLGTYKWRIPKKALDNYIQEKMG